MTYQITLNGRSPRYSIGDLVRPSSGRAWHPTIENKIGVVVSIDRTVGKLSNIVPYSYLVKWADNTTSEWSASAIELAKED